MMRIVDFTLGHAEQAATLAMRNYESEREYAPALPPVDSWPDLTEFARNGLGVAAFEGDEMIGFLCGVSPFANAFHSTKATGVFSPMHANGTAPENRAAIYARMYQAAGEKWARAGASSHAVCLYAHDGEAQAQFFRYGFGLRCVDAIRGMESVVYVPCGEYEFCELPQGEYEAVFPLNQLLNEHQCASPYFMSRKPDTLESYIKSSAERSSRFFAAKYQQKICAYLTVLADGETFIQELPGYIHVGGAYCLPEHRGRGVYQNLLGLAVSVLAKDGYTRLGVDFESINPTGYAFWLKHFSAYTHSVVRRIDEDVLEGMR